MSVGQTYGLCEIKKMTIVSHNDFELDIFSAYRSLSIYEDLFSPSITARLTLEDSNGILNFLPIIGQETVNISYVTQGLTEAIELEMIVNKITDLESDVGTQTYNLELVSVDMITNFEQRISEYFEGSSTEIAEKCFQRLESKKTFEFEPSEDKYDEELGVIIPNMTPMKAISFLCGKAFHEEYKSSSYMFYETSKKYVMKPMEMLTHEEPKNEFSLGSYKNAGTDGTELVDANVENKKAITYKFLSNFSVLDNITNGVFASKVSVVDMITRTKTDLEHSMWEDHEEYKYLNENHTVFAYLHLAGNKKNAIDLTSTGISGIALETVTAEDGSMPLLSPMSSIAGQLSIIVGSYHLLKPYNGMGTLIGEIENIDPRVVTVIGAGVAGTEAIKKAINNKAYLT